MLGYSIAVSVIAIMISIGGIIFGLGYAMDNAKLKNFGRDELFQSFINGAIVGVLFLFFSPGGIGTGIINGIVSGTGATASCTGYMSTNYAICFASNYLVGVQEVSINGASYPSLLDSSLELLVPVSAVYIVLGFISSAQLSLGVISVSFSTILAPVLAQQDFIINALTFSIISIYTQSALLGVISVVAVPILLPVGIVLRTFYPTRKLGGTIIAIAIGLFAVFPLTYLLDAQITSSFAASLNQNSLNTFTIQAEGVQNALLSVGGSAISANTITGTALSLINSASSLASSFSSVLNELVAWLSILIIEVFFFPVFSIILTVTSIRELAKILGSEVSFGRFDIF